MVDGTHCQFDETRRSERGDFVSSVVKYTDRKAPALFELLGLPMPAERVLIRFAPFRGGRFTRPSLLELGDDHRADDLGCVIHECVHWAQQADPVVYNSKMRIFEGVADYYRIVLSDDRQGDYINNGKRTLVSMFNFNDLYDSGSEFIAYLRRRSGNMQFVKELNDALRTNSISTIDQFFRDRFGKSFDELLADYPKQRQATVGSRPSEVSRFEFFTDMG